MKPTYRIHDTKLLFELPAEAQSPFLIRALYHRLMNLLRDRGFEVGFDPFNGAKGYKPRKWHWQTSLGRCRDLFFHAELHTHHGFSSAPNHHAGRIEIEFWQDVILEEGRTDGRHSFNKRQRMPYLIRLHYQLTLQHLLRFLRALFPTLEHDTSRVWPEDQPRIGHAYLMHRMKGWEWHIPKEGYDPFTFLPGSNYGGQYLTDALGQTIVPGQMYKAYAGYSHHRLIQGRAVYNFNGNWLLYANDHSQHGYAYHNQIYPLHTPLPRRRKCTLKEQISKASQKLDRLMKAHQFEQCISTRDFLRRHS